MIVVDTSVAVKWLLPDEDFVDASAALLARELAGGAILAPPLLRSEVTNALRQRMRRAELTRDEAVVILSRFLALPITVIEPDGLYRHALLLAVDHQLPAVYDAHFLALAQIQGCDFWTADQRLRRQVGGGLHFVRWIGEYE
jgi:predicted nucleic acid-binding protein